MDTRPQQNGLPLREDIAIPSKIYSAPRRFDVFTILVVTIAYALLFVLMGALPYVESSVMVWASAIIGLFLAYIAIAQIVLYHGKYPRLASVVAGIAAFAVLMCWQLIRYQTGPPTRLGTLIFVLCYIVAMGGTIGYLAGATVGGVFLVADKLRTKIQWSRSNREQDEPEELW